MVDPVDDDDRVSFLGKVKVGFVLLVGLSAGLITLQTGADPPVFAGALVAGCLVGAGLVRLAFPSGDDLNTRSGRGPRR